MWAQPITLRPVPNFGSERRTGGLQEALSYLHAGLVEGRVGFEPATPGLRVRSSSAESATQAPPARMRARVPIDEASADDLPGKQATAPGRPLATCVRCNVKCRLERETGIEPVLPAWKEQAHCKEQG